MIVLGIQCPTPNFCILSKEHDRPVRGFVDCAHGQIQRVINVIYRWVIKEGVCGIFPLVCHQLAYTYTLYILFSLSCSLKLVQVEILEIYRDTNKMFMEVGIDRFEQ